MFYEEQPKYRERMPECYRDVLEIKGLEQAIMPQLEKMYRKVKEQTDDRLVASAGAEGIARWERILELQPTAWDTLAQRRARAMARLSGTAQMNLEQFRQWVRTRLKTDIWVEVDRYILSVTYRGTLTPELLAEFRQEAMEKIPANLALFIDYKWETYQDEQAHFQYYGDQQEISYMSLKMGDLKQGEKLISGSLSAMETRMMRKRREICDV